MSQQEPYAKVTMYHFEVGGEFYAISYVSDDSLHVEELRKNGQEDCHFDNEMEKVDGLWHWQMDDDEMDQYSYNHDHRAICKYINDNGAPAV